MSEASPPITPATNGGALNPGATLAGGRYVITRKLGEGGMGVVYLSARTLFEGAAITLFEGRGAKENAGSRPATI